MKAQQSPASTAPVALGQALAPASLAPSPAAARVGGHKVGEQVKSQGRGQGRGLWLGLGRVIFSWPFMLGLLVLASILSLFIGVISIDLQGVLGLNPAQLEIIQLTRAPRLAAIILSGASLALCGLIMQQLTQNKFVSPTTVGTMDCARLGMLIALVLFGTASFFTQVLIAAACALGGSLIFLKILKSVRIKEPIFVPLIGLMFGGIISALTTFFAYSLNYIQTIQAWMQGSFANVMQGNYELIYLVLPCFVLAFVFAKRLTIAGLGEELARNLGLGYGLVLGVGLVIVSFITSIIIVCVGAIPFIGLIIPNIISIYRGDNLQKNLPYIMLAGALFLLLCDLVARLVIFPYEMPISIVAGAIGSVLFIYLLGRR